MGATLEAVAHAAWTAGTPGARLLRAALVPAGVAYGVVATVRNRLYDTGWLPAARLPAYVVSVGNLTVGGTGKTPAALWLARALAARGRRPGIVARGYGKLRRGVVVVGEAGRPLVGAEEGGDEAVMMARRFAGPVVTGERRAEAARLACTRFGLDTVVLDDGFQHRALARDADLVLVTPRRWARAPPPVHCASRRRARAARALPRSRRCRPGRRDRPLPRAPVPTALSAAETVGHRDLAALPAAPDGGRRHRPAGALRRDLEALGRASAGSCASPTTMPTTPTTRRRSWRRRAARRSSRPRRTW
jgi:tetraacyldisaccharide 4'-kinase